MRELDNLTALEKYIRNLYAPEDELLVHIKEQARRQAKPIQIGPEEGKLLQILIQLTRPQKIVEIGTLLGYSTIWMGRAASPDCKIYTIEKNADYAASAEENFRQAGIQEQVELKTGKAKEVLSEIETAGPVDMVFIDADKANYPYYLDWAYNNLKAGGLIVADNTLLFGSVYKPEQDQGVREELVSAMQQFNNKLADSEKFESLLLPYKEGFSIGIKK
jgi:predicted O-methyltransferase YrrM